MESQENGIILWNNWFCSKCLIRVYYFCVFESKTAEVEVEDKIGIGEKGAFVLDHSETCSWRWSGLFADAYSFYGLQLMEHGGGLNWTKRQNGHSWPIIWVVLGLSTYIFPLFPA